MNLVDSSGWLEYFSDGQNADFFAPVIEDTENLIVSTINLYEVFKRVLQQRGESEALQAVALMHQARIVGFTASLSLEAAKLSIDFKLPMADSILLATAQGENATLWSEDEHFKDIPDVQFIEKKSV
jgi:predicted nucleic acid-binding protein